jgi:geranylgeranyl diphosphate synthase type II
MSIDLDKYLRTKREIVEEKLEKIWDSADDPSDLLHAMLYSLMGGGKRLRPILCIAASEAVGGSYEVVLPAACALELIHTYSLIHDDLPALDNDDLRRGKPTNHKVYGEATAILAGDALLTRAFEILTDLKHYAVNPLLGMRTAHLIARAAGYTGMIQGQMLDMASEGKDIARAQLEKIHRLKTGALLEASVRSGAILGGGTEKEIEALSEYGKCIGIAFQVYDDILNIEGSQERLGKKTGTDFDRKKATYPLLLGMSQAKAKGHDMVANALQSLTVFDQRGDPLRALARYIAERTR